MGVLEVSLWLTELDLPSMLGGGVSKYAQRIGSLSVSKERALGMVFVS